MFFRQIPAQSCQWAKAATCFYPETILYIPVFRVTVLSGTVFTFVVTGVWRQGFHTLDNLREARKRETTLTSMRAEVLVCVKKSKGKLANASDSWLTKGNKITKAVQSFTSLDFRNSHPLLCTSAFTTYFWKNSLLLNILSEMVPLQRSTYVVRHCNL